MEPTYKIGDKVRIKVRTKRESAYRCSFIDDMANKAGTICVVQSVYRGGNYSSGQLPDDGYNYNLENGGCWTYTSAMLELATPSLPKEEPKVLDFTHKKKHYQLNFSV